MLPRDRLGKTLRDGDTVIVRFRVERAYSDREIAVLCTDGKPFRMAVQAAQCAVVPRSSTHAIGDPGASDRAVRAPRARSRPVP
jgi:hypothetical protein